MKPSKKTKTTSEAGLKEEIRRLKAYAKLLEDQRNKFKEMLVDVVRKWRAYDEKVANICYDSCKLVGLKVAALDYKLNAKKTDGKGK
jgi:hypothetical protein